MMLSPVSRPTSLTSAKRPGAPMSKRFPPPAGTTKPRLSVMSCPPDGPEELLHHLLVDFHLPVMQQTGSLGHPQGSGVFRMNDGHDPWPFEIRSRIVEHTPRGFSRVAVTPARRIERVAEVGRLQELCTVRRLRALK